MNGMNERGNTILIVVVIMTIVFTLTFFISTVAGRSLRSATMFYEDNSAYNLAESVINYVVEDMNSCIQENTPYIISLVNSYLNPDRQIDTAIAIKAPDTPSNDQIKIVMSTNNTIKMVDLENNDKLQTAFGKCKNSSNEYANIDNINDLVMKQLGVLFNECYSINMEGKLLTILNAKVNISEGNYSEVTVKARGNWNKKIIDVYAIVTTKSNETDETKEEKIATTTLSFENILNDITYSIKYNYDYIDKDRTLDESMLVYGELELQDSTLKTNGAIKIRDDIVLSSSNLEANSLCTFKDIKLENSNNRLITIEDLIADNLMADGENQQVSSANIYVDDSIKINATASVLGALNVIYSFNGMDVFGEGSILKSNYIYNLNPYVPDIDTIELKDGNVYYKELGENFAITKQETQIIENNTNSYEVKEVEVEDIENTIEMQELDREAKMEQLNKIVECFCLGRKLQTDAENTYGMYVPTAEEDGFSLTTTVNGFANTMEAEDYFYKADKKEKINVMPWTLCGKDIDNLTYSSEKNYYDNMINIIENPLTYYKQTDFNKDLIGDSLPQNLYGLKAYTTVSRAELIDSLEEEKINIAVFEDILDTGKIVDIRKNEALIDWKETNVYYTSNNSVDISKLCTYKNENKENKATAIPVAIVYGGETPLHISASSIDTKFRGIIISKGEVVIDSNIDLEGMIIVDKRLLVQNSNVNITPNENIVLDINNEKIYRMLNLQDNLRAVKCQITGDFSEFRIKLDYIRQVEESEMVNDK